MVSFMISVRFFSLTHYLYLYFAKYMIDCFAFPSSNISIKSNQMKKLQSWFSCLSKTNCLLLKLLASRFYVSNTHPFCLFTTAQTTTPTTTTTTNDHSVWSYLYIHTKCTVHSYKSAICLYCFGFNLLFVDYYTTVQAY